MTSNPLKILGDLFFKFAHWIGARVTLLCTTTGRFMLFFWCTIKTLIYTKPKYGKIAEQMYQIGVQSLVITIITGAFAGAVLAYQSFEGLRKFGGEELLGALVALSITRELGPVLTGLMVTGRAGSSIAAEIGTMRITEQIDALDTLRINPYQYLIIPRIIGATLIMPFLTVFSMIAGTLGGYIIATQILGLTPDEYTAHISEFIDVFDVIGGLIKAAAFGFVISWVSCYKGFNTSGGARGVGLATTNSVVASSILIIIVNYFLAMILFGVSS